MVTILSSLFSGLVATCITLLVTHIINKKQEKRNFKIQLFKDIIAYRTDIVPNCIPTGNFQKAVNQVFIAYNDCPEVLKAFEQFRKNVIYKSNTKVENDQIIDNLVMLLKAMAQEIKIDFSFSNDDLFTKPVLVGTPVVSIVHKNTSEKNI